MGSEGMLAETGPKMEQERRESRREERGVKARTRNSGPTSHQFGLVKGNCQLNYVEIGAENTRLRAPETRRGQRDAL